MGVAGGAGGDRGAGGGFPPVRTPGAPESVSPLPRTRCAAGSLPRAAGPHRARVGRHSPDRALGARRGRIAPGAIRPRLRPRLHPGPRGRPSRRSPHDRSHGGDSGDSRGGGRGPGGGPGGGHSGGGPPDRVACRRDRRVGARSRPVRSADRPASSRRGGAPRDAELGGRRDGQRLPGAPRRRSTD